MCIKSASTLQDHMGDMSVKGLSQYLKEDCLIDGEILRIGSLMEVYTNFRCRTHMFTASKSQHILFVFGFPYLHIYVCT